MRTLLISCIKFYKNLFVNSLPVCNFRPTCSEYAIDALEKKSFFKAIYLIIKRLIKCHPLSSWRTDNLR